MNPETSRIREIASVLGISISSVDRALHNRSGVSAKTREKVGSDLYQHGEQPSRDSGPPRKARPQQVRIIATDHFPEIVLLIGSGHIAAALYQQPLTQGKMAFEILCSYLVRGSLPQSINRLAPNIVLRSNVSMFL